MSRSGHKIICRRTKIYRIFAISRRCDVSRETYFVVVWRVDSVGGGVILRTPSPGERLLINKNSLLHIATGLLFVFIGDAATWADPAIPAVDFGKIPQAGQKPPLPSVHVPLGDGG